jgi:hypothetical protein
MAKYPRMVTGRVPTTRAQKYVSDSLFFLVNMARKIEPISLLK